METNINAERDENFLKDRYEYLLSLMENKYHYSGLKKHQLLEYLEEFDGIENKIEQLEKYIEAVDYIDAACGFDKKVRDIRSEIEGPKNQS